MKLKGFLVFFAFVFATDVFAQAPLIEYTVSARNPISHLYSVEMLINGVRGASLDIAMPAWSPGVYVIRDFAANVQELETHSQRNQPLQVRQTDKQTWRISKSSNDDVRIRYRVFSTGLNDEMADLTPAAVFMYVAGQTSLPSTVKYETEDGWKVYTSMEKRGDRYYAPDYQTLVTSPVFLGEFKVLDFKAANTNVRVVFSNKRTQFTELQIEADLTDIVEASGDLLGSIPFKNYTFLVRVQSATGSSSVGYPDSARVNVGENDFVNENAYNAFLVAATQGLTKAWYGKAARPDSMQPFDYSREAYSRILWFTDGVAAYTADMLLLRAGILTSPEYFPRLSAEIDSLQHQSGRLVASLEEASLNAWVRGENSVNATIPYTLKGKIAGLLLDADIRGRSGGTKKLDDVLRRLLAGAASRRGGMTEAMLEEEIRGATGVNVSEFFAAVVRGKNEIDYNRYLEPVGVKVSGQKAPATIYFGIEFDRIEANQARVRRVFPSSPAEAAKVDAGDVVIAMDSDRVTFDNLTSRIHSKPLGKAVVLTVMRGDRLLTLSIVPGLTQTESWTIEENLQATPEQKRLREAWVAPARSGK